MGVLTFGFFGDFSLDPKSLARKPLPSTLVFSTFSYTVSLYNRMGRQKLTLTGAFFSFSLGSSTVTALDPSAGAATAAVSVAGASDSIVSFLDSTGSSTSATGSGLATVPSTLVATSASECAVPEAAWVVVGCLAWTSASVLHSEVKRERESQLTSGSSLVGSMGAAATSGSAAVVVSAFGSSTATTGASSGASDTTTGAAGASATTVWEVERDR